ncbi:MAG: hypothetical protein KBT19_06270 [Lachnospiraceae bacterium]|nr:hypothetical protein [Candidatus Colinaster equi]
MKKSTIRITVITLICLAIIAILAIANNRFQAANNTGTISLQTSGVQEVINLNTLTTAEISVTLPNSDSYMSEGTLLSELLSQYGINQCDSVTITASDNFSADVTGDEIFGGDTVYLLVEDGHACSWVSTDADRKRNVTDITTITVK